MSGKVQVATRFIFIRLFVLCKLVYSYLCLNIQILHVSMLVIFFYSNNEQNISLLGDSIYKLRFQNVELVKEINALITDNRISVRPDTMNLMGKQKNQLIWKDISMKDLSIGYFNVPSSMIEIFNKSISSLRQKIK